MNDAATTPDDPWADMLDEAEAGRGVWLEPDEVLGLHGEWSALRATLAMSRRTTNDLYAAGQSLAKQLEAMRTRLRWISMLGTDVAPGADHEHFYRSQLHTAIGAAARAIDGDRCAFCDSPQGGDHKSYCPVPDLLEEMDALALERVVAARRRLIASSRTDTNNE